MPQPSRHFAFKHPLFRKGETATGIWYADCVYYLWWEFLRRHDGYKETCENAGDGAYAPLYADFGDVHSTDFRTWWRQDDRGARLFSEPPAIDTVSVIDAKDIAAAPDAWQPEQVLLIAVPLRLPKRHVQQRIEKLLKTHHPRKRGQRDHAVSRARYPIARQFSTHSLKTALQAWDMRQADPSLTLWRVTQNLPGYSITLSDDELNDTGRGNVVLQAKAQMSVAAHRKLRQAETLIEGVGRGVFPAA